MPYMTINGAKLHYIDSGGDQDVVVFAHGLGWSHRMFSAQVERLGKSFRCIAFDFRGQGKSQTTPAGYDIDDLTIDTHELIQQLTDKSVHFVGLSMGGFVGMRLAARHPSLVKSLTLLNTSASSEPFTKRLKYRLMSLAVRFVGLKSVLRASMRVMFGKTFLTDGSRRAEVEAWQNELLANCRQGIVRAIGGVVRRQAITAELGKIHVPTLVIVGEEDIATPPHCGQRITESIPGATIQQIANCGHSSTIEEATEVNDLLLAFLNSINESTSNNPTN